MKVEIKEKTEEPLLSRQRLVGEIAYTGPVPSRDEVKKSISSQLKAQVDLIDVEHIYPSFGAGNAKLLAFAYKDKKALELLKKNKGKKKKKEGEKKEEAKEEKPKEAEKKPKEEKAEKPAEKKEDKKEDKPKAEEKPKEDKKA